jgi:hypothetical protein
MVVEAIALICLESLSSKKVERIFTLQHAGMSEITLVLYRAGVKELNFRNFVVFKVIQVLYYYIYS